MERHNSHIILESNSSQKHEYENDENGNIKVDINDDTIYKSYVRKKEKLDIKNILNENTKRRI